MSKTASYLQLEKIIPLPIHAESNALAQEWNKELWIWINQPQRKSSLLLKAKEPGQINVVAELPIMANAMNCHEQQMIVTGSKNKGQPYICGLDSNGQVLWDFLFSNIKPITWPVAACSSPPVIAWQETTGKIEVGLMDVQSRSILRKPTFTVDNPPARLFSWKNQIWGLWREKGKIHVIDFVKGNRQEVLTDNIYASEFSLGHSNEGNYFGWNNGNQPVWLLPKKSSATSVGLEGDSLGTIRLISGNIPLMWVQKSNVGINGNMEWESTFVLPGEKYYTVDGFVFAVAWWQQRIALVKNSAVFLLKKQ